MKSSMPPAALAALLLAFPAGATVVPTPEEMQRAFARAAAPQAETVRPTRLRLAPAEPLLPSAPASDPSRPLSGYLDLAALPGAPVRAPALLREALSPDAAPADPAAAVPDRDPLRAPPSWRPSGLPGLFRAGADLIDTGLGLRMFAASAAALPAPALAAQLIDPQAAREEAAPEAGADVRAALAAVGAFAVLAVVLFLLSYRPERRPQPLQSRPDRRRKAPIAAARAPRRDAAARAAERVTAP